MDAEHTVGLATSGMNLTDLLGQLVVPPVPRRWFALPPCPVAAGGDAQDPAHGRHGMTRLLSLHELKRRYRRESLPRAGACSGDPLGIGEEGRGFF
jgi:hypothetical protein